MYVPAHLNEQRIEPLHRLIRERPLGTPVTSADGLNAHHIPFVGQRTLGKGRIESRMDNAPIHAFAAKLQFRSICHGRNT